MTAIRRKLGGHINISAHRRDQRRSNVAWRGIKSVELWKGNSQWRKKSFYLQAGD
jgi:mRNA-degrading endonuclease toxin of MazEF toxin-antitoxin module